MTSHQWTRREFELLGFEWCADIIDATTGRRGKLVFMGGDAEGDALIQRIETDPTYGFEQALADADAARRRHARMEYAVDHPVHGLIIDKGRR